MPTDAADDALARILPLVQPFPPQIAVANERDEFAERCVPGWISNAALSVHLRRYEFAMPRVGGLDVLDIACGVGYGSAILGQVAKSVLGVDIDAAAVAAATERYRDLPNVRFRQGDAQQIDLPDGAVDAAVSFETIEHVPDWRKVLDELKRVVRKGGPIVLSTPNLNIYSLGSTRSSNPHHLKEFTPQEWDQVLRERFASVEVFGQTAQRRIAGLFLPLARALGLKKAPAPPPPAAPATPPPQEPPLTREYLARWENRHRVYPYRFADFNQPMFLLGVCRS